MPHQTHIVEDVGPSLHGDALEDGEHSEEDVVEVGDAVVGPLPVLPAGGPALALPGRGLLSAWKISHLVTCREQQPGKSHRLKPFEQLVLLHPSCTAAGMSAPVQASSCCYGHVEVITPM